MSLCALDRLYHFLHYRIQQHTKLFGKTAGKVCERIGTRCRKLMSRDMSLHKSPIFYFTLSQVKIQTTEATDDQTQKSFFERDIGMVGKLC